MICIYLYLLWVCIQFKSFGNLGLLGMNFLFLLGTYQHFKYFKSVCIALFAMLCIVFSKLDIFFTNSLASRLDLLKLSYFSIRDNFLFGSGFGNSKLALYSQDFSELSSFMYYNKLILIDSHNLLIKYFLEGGLIGVTLFLIPVLIVLYNMILCKQNRYLLPIVLGYLMGCLYYRNAFSSEAYFSISEFVFYTIFISVSGFQVSRHSNFNKSAFFFLSFFLFIFSVIDNYLFKREILINRFRNQLYSKNELVEGVYNPVFNTKVLSGMSFDFLLGKSAIVEGDLERAETMFKKVIYVNPFNIEANLELARIYLLNSNKNEAYSYATAALKLNNNYNKSLLFSALSSYEDSPTEALSFISKIESSTYPRPYMPLVNILRHRMHSAKDFRVIDELFLESIIAVYLDPIVVPEEHIMPNELIEVEKKVLDFLENRITN